MAITLRVYHWFFTEPKVDAVCADIHGISKGEIRAIYLECLHTMHQNMTDTLFISKLETIIFENLHSNIDLRGKTTRTRQRSDKILSQKCRLLVVSMVKNGMCVETENVAFLRFPSMTKKLPELIKELESKVNGGIASGKSRREKSEQLFNRSSTEAQQKLNYPIQSNPNTSSNEEVLSLVAEAPREQASSNKKVTDNTPYEAIVQAINETALKDRWKIKRLTPAMRAKIKTRYIDHPDIDEFTAVVRKANESTFLCNSNWFKAEWFLKSETNWSKVVDGDYDDSTGTNAAREETLLERMRRESGEA